MALLYYFNLLLAMKMAKEAGVEIPKTNNLPEHL